MLCPDGIYCRNSGACSGVCVRFPVGHSQPAHPECYVGWVAMAFAKLGFVRDRMTPEQVVVVQDFLDGKFD